MKMNTDCEVVFFVSSSGHCTLDCPYCIIDPIAKREPSLNCGDIDFLLETFKKKAFLAFSGKGDFFAGYKKSDKFLASILDREVEVALDINGVLIHEFSELSDTHLEKIRYVNLSMHYQQIKEKNLLYVWAENARILVEKKGNDMLLGTIVSPMLMDHWEESLLFYNKEIFSKTGKKIVLVKDINRSFSKQEEDFLVSLKERFSDIVERIYQEDFAETFRDCNHVFCPAGSSYFRIWNNGDIQGCPNIHQLAQCGNVKERRVVPRNKPFCCAEMKTANRRRATILYVRQPQETL
jgi:MoaA/NifB/PqqE/SkfB family radical SAM enzyme